MLNRLLPLSYLKAIPPSCPMIQMKHLYRRFAYALLNEIIKQSPKDALGSPLLTNTPTAKQWEKIEYIYQLLFEDYLARREMWLKRLDVTVQSFLWNNRTKNLEDKIMTLYEPMRKQLPHIPDVKLSNLLSAREDICSQQKTCASKAGSVFKLKNYVIGSVPDRGGRVNEFEPLARETFQAQQNQRMPQDQRQNQRGRGRGRDDRGRGARGRNRNDSGGIYSAGRGNADRSSNFDRRYDSHFDDRQVQPQYSNSGYRQEHPSHYDYGHQPMYSDRAFDPRFDRNAAYQQGPRVQGNWRNDNDQIYRRSSNTRHNNQYSRY
ncbi:hypothetical protein GJ496_007188 [Pomphorhynchus laevis]|nr:hypothetical protein GJ496_007188 [Pomphorhynchus laevis]